MRWPTELSLGAPADFDLTRPATGSERIVNQHTEDKISELEGLYASYLDAVREALDALVVHGKDSTAFRQADAAADLIWVDTRSLLIPKGHTR
jgi:hypothetical protein